MLGYVTLVAWATTIIVGLRMHGVKRMPVGIVLPHAALALTGIVVWIGYLASEWATVGGRKRRTYRLTDSGRKQLEGERSAWAEFASVIGGVLRPGIRQSG